MINNEKNLHNLRLKIRDELIEKMDFSRDISDEEILNEIDRKISINCRELDISIQDKTKLRQNVFHSLRKLDVLRNLLMTRQSQKS